MIILRDENNNFVASINNVFDYVVIKSRLPIIREQTFTFDFSNLYNTELINPENICAILPLNEEVQAEEVQAEEVKTKRKSKRGKKV